MSADKHDLIAKLRIDRDEVAANSVADEESVIARWRKPLVITVAVIVVLLLGVMIGRVSKQPEQIVVERDTSATKTSTTKSVSTPKSNSNRYVLDASGYVVARRWATVSSEFTGKVTEILVEEGMAVEKGQLLARIDAERAEAEYSLSKARLAAVQAGYREAQAQLNEVRLSLQRAKNLVERNLLSVAELDKAQASMDAWVAAVDTRKAEVKASEQQLELSRQQLDDTYIRAPFSGVVTGKNAQPGEIVSPMSAGGGFTRTGICTMVDMQSLEIEVDVNEAYINRVFADQLVHAKLDAYPDWLIPAKVIAVIPTADRQKATIKVRIKFDELDPRILPEMGVKVSFIEKVG